MTDTRTKLTGDDLAKLPRGMGERYELIEGDLIALSPTKPLHGFVTIAVTALLIAYNKQYKFGRVFAAETGFYTRGNNKTVRAPDVAFISYQRLPTGASLDDFLTVAPELVVEVISPSDRQSEIEQKVQEWLDFGVLMVLVVYPKQKQVDVYKNGEAVVRLNADDVVSGSEVLPGFESPVSAIFDE